MFQQWPRFTLFKQCAPTMALGHAGCLVRRNTATDSQTHIDGPISCSSLTIEREGHLKSCSFINLVTSHLCLLHSHENALINCMTPYTDTCRTQRQKSTIEHVLELFLILIAVFILSSHILSLTRFCNNFLPLTRSMSTSSYPSWFHYLNKLGDLYKSRRSLWRNILKCPPNSSLLIIIVLYSLYFCECWLRRKSRTLLPERGQTHCVKFIPPMRCLENSLYILIFSVLERW
jgi:hypothetical protein